MDLEGSHVRSIAVEAEPGSIVRMGKCHQPHHGFGSGSSDDTPLCIRPHRGGSSTPKRYTSTSLSRLSTRTSHLIDVRDIQSMLGDDDDRLEQAIIKVLDSAVQGGDAAGADDVLVRHVVTEISVLLRLRFYVQGGDWPSETPDLLEMDEVVRVWEAELEANLDEVGNVCLRIVSVRYLDRDLVVPLPGMVMAQLNAAVVDTYTASAPRHPETHRPLHDVRDERVDQGGIALQRRAEDHENMAVEEGEDRWPAWIPRWTWWIGL